MRLNSSIKSKLITIWPAVFLAVVTLAVFSTTLIIKDHTFYAYPDNIDQFFAWYQKLAHAIHGGFLPIWDANVSSGHSFVGELQAGVFYPVNLLWVWLFGSIHGISIFWLELIVVFHFWIASLGMYLAARTIGLGKIGSLVAGLAYAFGGGTTVRSVGQTAIFFGICYIPWVFFWFQRWLQTKSKLNLIWCSIALGFIILAGHIDPWYFSCVIVALSIIFRSIHPSFEPWLRTTYKQFIGLLVVVLGSLIVALPQVALSAQYLSRAVRFVGDPKPITSSQRVSNLTYTQSYSFQPQDVLSLVDPVKYPVADGNPLYVGLIGLVIILIGVFGLKKRLREHSVWKTQKNFLIGGSAFATLIMLGYWTFIPSLLRYVPLFSQVRQLARYSIIVQFMLVIILGICVEVVSLDLMNQFRTAKRKIVGAIGAVLLLGFLFLNTIYYYLLSKRTGSIDKHFVYQNAILFMAVAAILLIRKRIGYILLGAMVLSSIAAPVWFMPRISQVEATYPPNYYKITPAITYLERYYGQDRVLIEGKALPVNIGDVYNIQTIGGYGATLHQAYYQFLNEPDLLTQPGQHLDLLNVRFVVSASPEPKLKRVFFDKERKISVYERTQYLPRAYFADQLDACNNHLATCNPIKIINYSDSYIRLSYTSSKPETLVLSEVNYVGWQASIDSRPTTISAFSPTPTKLFRSIGVPAGTHEVEFRYRPFGL